MYVDFIIILIVNSDDRHCYLSNDKHCYLSDDRLYYLSDDKHCYLSDYRHFPKSDTEKIKVFIVSPSWTDDYIKENCLLGQ